MKRIPAHRLLFSLAGIAAVCMLMFGTVAAGPENIPPPKAKYDEDTLCVEPVEIMRRQHFEYILDHRDRTVIEGIRTKKHSLIGCIDCHITPNDEGVYARYSQETHFCASCHQFAAVRIDCFQCHADRPAEAIREALKPDQHARRPVQELLETLQFSTAVFTK
ncbi:MAG: hypothetical protein F4X93_00140 [Proteobacteria bacterium]|nr:hypothetical protein [Pseudomonadota bacterium]MYB88366.1 hypothetical protein [Pseudomonadota bacterium]